MGSAGWSGWPSHVPCSAFWIGYAAALPFVSRIDLNSMSLDDLKKLQKDVGKVIDGYEQKQRKEALTAAEAVTCH